MGVKPCSCFGWALAPHPGQPPFAKLAPPPHLFQPALLWGWLSCHRWGGWHRATPPAPAFQAGLQPSTCVETGSLPPLPDLLLAGAKGTDRTQTRTQPSLLLRQRPALLDQLGNLFVGYPAVLAALQHSYGAVRGDCERGHGRACGSAEHPGLKRGAFLIRFLNTPL